ncbi:MAG: hypothetical protein M1484_02565 [Patescibacteria group bacterium]|nr:hypothetical protein [Patescibacteria group bacterium]MCL5431964.1 hypothetical protein [Patescibacteria group bacterium]
MKNINQSQIKLLANFCSDVAKGALLSGLGFTYALTSPLPERLFSLMVSLVIAGMALLLALSISNNILTNDQ